MLAPGDRFVLESLVCSFKRSKGQRIQMGSMLSMISPSGTRVDPCLVQAFASDFGHAYACKVNVAFPLAVTDGFTYTFVSVPAQYLSQDPRSVVIERQAIVALDPVQGLLLDSLIGRFGTHELDVFRWFLEALTGKPHTVEVRVDDVRFLPPPKPPGYGPLPRSEKSATQTEKASTPPDSKRSGKKPGSR